MLSTAPDRTTEPRDHRDPGRDPLAALAAQRGAPTAPTTPRYAAAEEVRSLARAGHRLSLSVLMRTMPAGRMIPADRDRLRALVRDAHRRIAEQRGERAELAALAASLDTLAAQAAAGPTDRGLTLLASPRQAHLHHLRISPRDRVVLDPTFATRDLIRSAAEDPAFLLLAIDARSARLFHYDQRYLRPVLAHDFPVLRPATPIGSRSAVGASERARREQVRAFLRQVDSRMATRLAEEPLPVVLVADERTAAGYQAVAGRRRLAAVVRSGRTNATLAQLEDIGRTALAGHVTDRAAAALDIIPRMLRRRRAVAGLPDAWAAMLIAQPEAVVVEHSYAAAVRVTGTGFTPADDPEHPDVIDDAVDELLEAVLTRGGEAITVPDGALRHHGRLVLILRHRLGSGTEPAWGDAPPV